MLVALAGSFGISGRLVPLLISPKKADVYFDADVPRVFRNVTSRLSNHARTALHPAVSLTGWSAARALATVVEDETAVRMLIATNAAVTAGLLLWVLSVLELSLADRALVAALALSTAAAWIWFTVPEIFPFGAPGLLLSVGLVAGADARARASGWFGLAQFATLGATVSNWPASLAATFLGRPFRDAVRITLAVVALVALVLVVERPLFPDQRFPLRNETRFLRPVTASSLSEVVRVFFVTSVVMPAIHEEPDTSSPAKRLSTVRSAIGSTGNAGLVASVAWVGLLGVGIAGLVALRGRQAFLATMGAALFGQLGLHLVYGRETFLYAGHYMPLLLVVAACGLLTRVAPVARLLIVLVIVGAVQANLDQLAMVLAYLQR